MTRLTIEMPAFPQEGERTRRTDAIETAELDDATATFTRWFECWARAA